MSEYETDPIISHNVATMAGFTVAALDGTAGEVVDAPMGEDTDVVVMDIGKWIFGKRVVVPKNLIKMVDLDSNTVYVDRTRAELKDSPPYRMSSITI